MIGAALLAASTVAFTVASGDATPSSESKQGGTPPKVDLAVNPAPPPRDTTIQASFAPVVKKVSPSVVRVFTTTKSKQASVSEFPGFDHPLFRRFFGEEGQGNRQYRFYTPPQRGVGSGVIVTRDGYILTNNHVVENADEVKVALNDGRELTAKVIGKDPKTDVAVLKVDARDLPNIELTDSDQIETGDIVLALGNPFGIGQTVTMGMVSATGRATLGLDYEDFIQTDAAINPGNSGGALVDVQGRLVGINTAILSRSGGNQGIGFAIPINLAREIMESLVRYGKVTRGYLGVMIQDLTPTLAKEFKLDDRKGVLIGEVLPNGPAAKSGLKDGDVVLEYNGKPVIDSRRLKLEVARTRPGETVPVKIWRDGDTRVIKVTPKELPGSGELARGDTTAGDSGERLKGVAVSDLDRQVRQELNVPDHVQGAVVTDVAPDSAAARAGLQPGDVIMEINRTRVKSADEAVRLTEGGREDRTTLLRIWSKGGSRYLVVDESE
ncbi:MAG: DegQ family serine endoprotease [Verrucomicrobia bacterium]|nr:DegQ family serine endoprotease [Verrucomicrobiota bacterium]